MIYIEMVGGLHFFGLTQPRLWSGLSLSALASPLAALSVSALSLRPIRPRTSTHGPPRKGGLTTDLLFPAKTHNHFL